ncbi:hypothetical protein KY290_026338 [Solanum tuberosum]|uniref:Uncharacterized protein n=1 Tax=Solanum tuberosum TaxID=4113 RepID=A0ABQ7UY36_SOLTU|nr:hypothetical protein KY289_025367 [Solanum tuberosum]KAH0674247.1 hypothetical protein KY284_025334 [Solanum tuberosum]KAH0677321.1 hypothetical protein KY285_025122 [Solanum tuberosum]KAH0756068.1 hypothetical protein KY290_026338 [Solanum tuberosum]
MIEAIPKGIVTGGVKKSLDIAEMEEVLLPPELRRELMPNHVAVIIDGDRRWAKIRGLPVALGYEAGI